MTAQPNIPTLLHLEDLQVGQRFESGTHAIGEAEIKAFAVAFDPQPFHLDGEAAKATLFGGLAASGWHTAAITVRLNVEGGLPFAGRLIGAGAERAGPSRPDPATSCMSKARSSTSCRHARAPIAAW
jgi:acyl dehydratase